MPLTDCKIYLQLNWSKTCVMSSIAGNTEFKITKKNLYVPIVTLSNKDFVKLIKQLNEGFKRSFYCNRYKTKMDS